MLTVKGRGVEARVQGRALRLGAGRLLLEFNARAGDLDADAVALEAESCPPLAKDVSIAA